MNHLISRNLKTQNLITRNLAITTMLTAAFAVQAASAQIIPENKAYGRQDRIVGVWDVDVTVTNCLGLEVARFQALHQYNFGGTGQIVPNTPPTALSPHLMVWAHDHKDQYLMAFKMYRYDSGGEFIGWIEVNNEVSVNEEAGEYSGSGVADIYNAAGVRVAGSCPSFEGTRFTG